MNLCWANVRLGTAEPGGCCAALLSSRSRFASCPLPCARRPDAKSALYTDTIKKGDLLLSRIQKLSKVIDVE